MSNKEKQKLQREGKVNLEAQEAMSLAYHRLNLLLGED